MAVIVLNAGVAFEHRSAGGPSIGAHNLVAFYIRAAAVDTRQFLSRDLTGRREGLVKLEIAGQETLMPFAGRGQVRPEFRDKIAFFGVNPVFVGLTCQVIEIDAGMRRILETGSKIAAVLNRALTGATAAYGAGAGLTGALFDFLRLRVADDAESSVYVASRSPLCAGDVFCLAVPDTKGTRVRLELEVADLGKRDPHSMLSVRVCRPRLELDDPAPGQRTRNTSAKPALSTWEWLQRAKRLRIFDFEAASGRHQATFTTRMQQIERLLSWQDFELFRVASARAAARHFLPISLAFTLTRREWHTRVTGELLRQTLRFAEALDLDPGGMSGRLSKQGETIVEVLAALSHRELPLFTFDGILLLYPGNQAPDTRPHGRLLLAQDPENPRRWTAAVRRDVRKWRDKPFGSFSFELEVLMV